MADPKEGYVSGIDIAVVGDVDSSGVFDGNTPKEGFNSGVVKYTSVTVDSDGVVSPAGNYLGIHRAVSVSVDANGDYSSNIPKEGFNSGAYRYSTSTNVSKEGDIEGHGVILGTIDSSGDFQTYSPDAWLLNGSDQYQWLDGSLPRHVADEAFLFTAGFTLSGPVATETTFWAQNDFNFTIIITTANKLRVFGRNTTPTTIIDVTSTDTIAHDDAVHALAIHGDLSTGTPVLTIVLDGSAISTTETTLTGTESVDFQASGHYCGAKSNNTNWWDGCLWNIGLDHGDSADIRDLTTQSNIDDIMSGNQMKDPGADASNYFGRQPVVFFQEPAATSGVNSGTGGAADDFTVIGGPFRCMRVGADIGNPPAYATITIWEQNYSKHDQPSTPPDYGLADYADAIEAEGGRMHYYVDDANQMHTGQTGRINSWIARGHSFSIMPIGGDSLKAGSYPNGPVWIQYDGAESNPTLTISDGGKTWALTTTEGGDDVTWIDVGVGTPYEKLKWGLCLGLVTDADGIDEEVNWSADINPQYTAAFDDAFSESVAPGVFVLTGTPPETTEPEFDQLRRKELEIDYGVEYLRDNLDLTPTEMVFHNPSWTSANDTVETFLRTQSVYADDWIGISGYSAIGATWDSDAAIDYGAPIAGTNTWEIGDGLGNNSGVATEYFKGDLATYDAMTSAEQEHRIRLAAKGFSCEGGKVNTFVPVILPHLAGKWSPEEVGWLANEFKIQKVQMITMNEAVTRF